MKKLFHALDNHLEQWLLITFYLMIFLTIIMEVIQRFILSHSTSWGEEVARYAFIYFIWIAVSLCVKERVHLKIELITKVLDNRGKAILLLVGEIVTAIIIAGSIYLSLQPVLLSIEFHSVTDGLRVVKAIFLFAVPFGCTLVLFRVGQNIVKDIRSIINDTPAFEGNDIF